MTIASFTSIIIFPYKQSSVLSACVGKFKFRVLTLVVLANLIFALLCIISSFSLYCQFSTLGGLFSVRAVDDVEVVGCAGVGLLLLLSEEAPNAQE